MQAFKCIVAVSVVLALSACSGVQVQSGPSRQSDMKTDFDASTQLECMLIDNDWGGVVDRLSESQREISNAFALVSESDSAIYKHWGSLQLAMKNSEEPTRDIGEFFLDGFPDCGIPGFRENSVELGKALLKLANLYRRGSTQTPGQAARMGGTLGQLAVVSREQNVPLIAMQSKIKEMLELIK